MKNNENVLDSLINGFYSSKSSDVIEKCILKAHADMSKRAKGHNEKIRDESLLWLKKHFETASPFSCSNQAEFDAWHENTCREYCKHMNSKFGSFFNLTYGRAQKVLNMTFKYLYCTEKYKQSVSKIVEFLHMPLDGYILAWYKDIVIDYVNKKQSTNFNKGSVSEWSKLNEEGKRTYMEVQEDIRSYLQDSKNLYYEYSIDTEIIDSDLDHEEDVPKCNKKTLHIRIPFDTERRSPFFAEFIVWKGEIIRAKVKNLFIGLNGIYKSWGEDVWAINDEKCDIQKELKTKLQVILKSIDSK